MKAQRLFTALLLMFSVLSGCSTVAPTSYHHHVNQSYDYGYRSDYDRSIDEADKAIEVNSEVTAVAYNNRGHAQELKGNYDVAMEDFNRALLLDSEYAVAYNNRGNVFYVKHDYDRAMADYNKAIQSDSDYATPYNNRGNLFNEGGEFDRALADYNKAIELDPEYAAAYYNRGACWFHKGEYDKAWADVKRSEELGFKPQPQFIERLRQASGTSAGAPPKAPMTM